jgi:hypothetical protein
MSPELPDDDEPVEPIILDGDALLTVLSAIEARLGPDDDNE